MTDSMRTQIATALCTTLGNISSLKYVAFDRVKLLTSDFKDYEMPAVQLIDISDDNVHEQGRAKKTWNFCLELVMGSTVTKTISQKDLWNLLEAIEIALFAKPNLGIPGIVHMKLIGTTTDLHLLVPYYSARIDLQIEYYQSLVHPC